MSVEKGRSSIRSNKLSRIVGQEVTVYFNRNGNSVKEEGILYRNNKGYNINDKHIPLNRLTTMKTSKGYSEVNLNYSNGRKR